MANPNPTPEPSPLAPALPSYNEVIRVHVFGDTDKGRKLVAEAVAEGLRALGLSVNELFGNEGEEVLAVTHADGVPAVFFALARPTGPAPDADGLPHFSTIKDQAEFRRIVETALANGRRGGLDEANKARTKYENGLAADFRTLCAREERDPEETTLRDLVDFVAGRAGLTGQGDGHAEGYAKATAEYMGLSAAIAELGDKLTGGPSAKLQSQNDSLRSELTAARAHVAELTAKLDKVASPGPLSIHVNEGATVYVYSDSKHTP